MNEKQKRDGAAAIRYLIDNRTIVQGYSAEGKYVQDALAVYIELTGNTKIEYDFNRVYWNDEQEEQERVSRMLNAANHSEMLSNHNNNNN